MRPATFADLLRRLTAAGGAALVLALAVFAASPELHEWLHHDDGDAAHESGCAIELFASGVSLPVGATAALPPAFAWRPAPAAVADEIFLTTPRFLRQPERGPPVHRVS